MIEKVTAFILRDTGDDRELLIFKHPTAGLQVPAGTIEPGESPEQAVIREVYEETGLRSATIVRKLAETHQFTPQNEAYLLQNIRLFGWPAQAAQRVGPLLTRGMRLQVHERKVGFIHIRQEEIDYDQSPPVTIQTTEGWLPGEFLTHEYIRHFFLMKVGEETPSSWNQVSDLGHTFQCHWVPFSPLPELIGEQAEWLEHLQGV